MVYQVLLAIIVSGNISYFPGAKFNSYEQCLRQGQARADSILQCDSAEVGMQVFFRCDEVPQQKDD